MRDWTYTEACGCTVTFFAAAEYKTSRMLPGGKCTRHTRRDQTNSRDKLIARAKVALRGYLFGKRQR